MQGIGEIIKLPEVKKGSERAELISFFVDTLRNKNNKKFPARMIAIKLSHLSMEDLRHTISIFKDNLNRKGLNGASKEFWWSIKFNINK